MREHAGAEHGPMAPEWVGTERPEPPTTAARGASLARWLDRAWPSGSLRAYLVVMILVATLPIAMQLTYKVVSELMDARERVQATLGHSAAGLAQSVAIEIGSTVDALTALSRTDALQSGQAPVLERWLRQRPPMRPQWRGIFLMGPDGRLLFDTAKPPGSAPADAPLEELARKALATGGAVVSDTLWPFAGESTSAVAVPIRMGGAEGYVIGARVDAEVWQRLLLRVQPPPGGFVALVDARQNVVASVGNLLRGRQIFATGAERAQARMGSDGAPEPAVATWRTVGAFDWQVSAGMPAAPIEAAERNSMLSALATMGLCLLLGVTLALLVAWRIAQPLQMLARAQRLPPSRRVPVREIALLRDALWTAQRRDATAHQRLHAKAAEFEALFENTPIGLAFADGADCGQVVYNPVMRSLLGMADQDDGREIPAQVFRGGKLLSPDEQPLQRACRLAQPVGPMELEIRLPGRAPVSVVASAVPLLDESGRPRGALSAVTDITELLQVMALWLAADRKRQEKQSLIDLACEAGCVGFFEYRFRPSELVWTAGQAGLFGRDPVVDAGSTPERGLRAWTSLVHADDRPRLRQALARALRTRRPRAHLEYRIAAAPEAAPRWLSSRLLLRYGADGRPEQVVGITVDVTEQKNAEQRRALQSVQEQAARRQAEAANRAKDEFLTMLSHELRNPLAAIAAASDVLSTGSGGPDTAGQALAIIQRQTQHLASMMRDLLDVSRVLRGSAVLARRPTDLAERVRSVRDALSVGGTMRQHAWTFDLQPAWIHADATRIEQVIVNLLQNAIKYTPEGRHIDVSVACVEDEAVLCVADTGDGIDAALLPHIFDLFRQGERMLDRQDGGLGVGLTLVQHLVKQHGGTIEVDTSEEGTAFTVRWPRVAPASATATAAGPGAARPRGPARRIVVVEDNADMRCSVTAYLQGEGHTVHAVEDGLDGLVLIIAERPDVAIVDIGLPGVDGYEVALRARAAGYAGRMVAVSGYGQPQDIAKARKAGFDDYLIKPITMEQLQNAMDRAS